MKTLPCLFLFLSLTSALPLASCVVPADVPPVAGVGAGYYTVLPSVWDEPYYYYGNRYYFGGVWQPGHYYHYGRHYDGRYLHGGRYYYGGRYDAGHHHAGDHHH